MIPRQVCAAFHLASRLIDLLLLLFFFFFFFFLFAVFAAGLLYMVSLTRARE